MFFKCPKVTTIVSSTSRTSVCFGQIVGLKYFAFLEENEYAMLCLK